MSNTVFSLKENKVFITTHDDKTLEITEGVDDGGFTVVFDNESVSGDESPVGVTQYNIRTTKKAKVVISLQWGAIGNKYLQQTFKDQTDGSYIKSLVVKRVNNTDNLVIYTSPSDIFVNKIADNSLTGVGGPRSWTLDCGALVSEDRIAIPA